MIPEYRLERITETIRAIKRGVPLSKTARTNEDPEAYLRKLEAQYAAAK